MNVPTCNSKDKLNYDMCQFLKMDDVDYRNHVLQERKFYNRYKSKKNLEDQNTLSTYAMVEKSFIKFNLPEIQELMNISNIKPIGESTAQQIRNFLIVNTKIPYSIIDIIISYFKVIEIKKVQEQYIKKHRQMS